MTKSFYQSASASHQKKERQKARDLRRSTWWREKIQRGVCYYCEKKFSKEDLSMDHKVPIARGGFSTKNNIVVCCKSCNSKKQASIPAEKILDQLRNK